MTKMTKIPNQRTKTEVRTSGLTKLDINVTHNTNLLDQEQKMKSKL